MRRRLMPILLPGRRRDRRCSWCELVMRGALPACAGNAPRDDAITARAAEIPLTHAPGSSLAGACDGARADRACGRDLIRLPSHGLVFAQIPDVVEPAG